MRNGKWSGAGLALGIWGALGSAGCASSSSPAESSAVAREGIPSASRGGVRWESLGAHADVVPIDIRDTAAAWTRAGARPLESAPAGVRVDISPVGVFVNGRDVQEAEFRAGSIGLLQRGRGRWRAGVPPLDDVRAALAAAFGAAGAKSWWLAMDQRTSVELAVAVLAAAQEAGAAPAVVVAQGPDGGAWALPLGGGSGCVDPAPPAIAASSADPRPHQYAVAPATVWGPCAVEEIATALNRALPAIARCEASAVESAPLLRDVADDVYVGAVIGTSGRVEGLYIDAAFAGADRGLVGCISSRLRAIATAPVSRRCLVNARLAFQAGDSPNSMLEEPANLGLEVVDVAAPLTWARAELRRNGLNLQLAHSRAGECPTGPRLFARLEDVRASTLASWLDDMIGSAVSARRVDLSADASMPVSAVISLAPAFWSGLRAASSQTVIHLSLAAER